MREGYIVRPVGINRIHANRLIIFSEQSDSVIFNIRVVPRASRSEIIGEMEGSLKVKISALPVDGAANEEVIKLFAKQFGVAKSKVSIVSGETSKTKRIRVAGVMPEQVRQLAGG